MTLQAKHISCGEVDRMHQKVIVGNREEHDGGSQHSQGVMWLDHKIFTTKFKCRAPKKVIVFPVRKHWFCKKERAQRAVQNHAYE